MGKPVVSFGPFRIDLATGELAREGKPMAIGQKGALLLAALAAAEGKAVSKAALMECGWPGLAVEEGNLTVQIAALRKALGQRGDGTEWIVTIARLGYRLALESAVAADDPHPPAVAVLPFANLGAGAEQDYFADGVAAEIITALARFRSFSVVSRSSSFAYKGRAVDIRQAASELGVRYLLEGSVRRDGERIRLDVQLIDGVTAGHLWAERFEDVIGHIFDFQDLITERVASTVEPSIEIAEMQRSRRERPQSVAVYDLYLRALAALHDESMEGNAAAHTLLQRALTIEPDNAMLLSHAAWVLEHRHAMGWPPFTTDDAAESVELARRALQHCAGDPRVMTHCGMALLQAGRDYEGGVAVLEAAFAANPNDLMVAAASGIALLHCGDAGIGVERLQRAVALGPRDADARFSLTGLAMAALFKRDFEAAISWATRSLALNAHFDATYWMLISAHAHRGELGEAHRHLESLRRIAPGVSLASIRAGQPAKDPSRFAVVLEGLALAGLRAE